MKADNEVTEEKGTDKYTSPISKDSETNEQKNIKSLTKKNSIDMDIVNKIDAHRSSTGYVPMPIPS